MYKLNLIALAAFAFVGINPLLAAQPVYHTVFECLGSRKNPICAGSWGSADSNGVFATVGGAVRGVDTGSRGQNNAIEWSCDYQHKLGAFCCEGQLDEEIDQATWCKKVIPVNK